MNRIAPPASNNASRTRPQVESVGTLAGAVTVEVVVEVLLVRFGSVVVEETVAVLETVPAELGLTTTSVIVAEPPEAIVPREQVTVPVPEQDPTDGVTDTNVVPAGRLSVTVTPAAELGPALATARV
jgi:hypothetical protein